MESFKKNMKDSQKILKNGKKSWKNLGRNAWKCPGGEIFALILKKKTLVGIPMGIYGGISMKIPEEHSRMNPGNT